MNNVDRAGSGLKISEVEFETEEKHARGAKTEDSGLEILAKLAKRYKHQIYVCERVAPDGEGEFDAICCTDSGIIVVDLKRLAGDFYEFSIRDKQICMFRSGQYLWINNPVLKLLGKTNALVEHHLRGGPEWAGVRSAFGGRIPVHSVVCFGPTTSFDKLPEADAAVSICTTRTLAKTVENLFLESTSVIGVGAQMQASMSVWARWGMLTSSRKGFLRCTITRITSSHWDASVWGLSSVESDGKKIKLAYENGRKATLPADGDVRIRAYVDSSERKVEIPAGTRFRYRVKGRL